MDKWLDRIGKILQAICLPVGTTLAVVGYLSKKVVVDTVRNKSIFSDPTYSLVSDPNFILISIGVVIMILGIVMAVVGFRHEKKN